MYIVKKIRSNTIKNKLNEVDYSYNKLPDIVMIFNFSIYILEFLVISRWYVEGTNKSISPTYGWDYLIWVFIFLEFLKFNIVHIIWIIKYNSYFPAINTRFNNYISCLISSWSLLYIKFLISEYYRNYVFDYVVYCIHFLNID